MRTIMRDSTNKAAEINGKGRRIKESFGDNVCKFFKSSFLGENLADEIGEFLTHLETVSQK